MSWVELAAAIWSIGKILQAVTAIAVLGIAVAFAINGNK